MAEPDATFQSLHALLGDAIASGRVRHRGNEAGGNASLFVKPLADGDGDVTARARAAMGCPDAGDFSPAAAITFSDLEMFFDESDEELVEGVLALLNAAGASGNGCFTFQRKATTDEAPPHDIGDAEVGYAPCEFRLGVGVVTATSVVGWEQVVVWT